MIIVLGCIAGIVLGIVVYRVILRQVPIRLMTAAEQRMLKIRNNASNAFFHGRGPTHKSRQVVMPSPDLIYSSCVYDLSRGPLRMSGDLPPAGHYWSLSLYAHNTDNYFVLNDRDLPERRFDLTIHPPMAGVAETKAAVTSPSITGIALIRMIQRRSDDVPIIQASQQSTSCQAAAPA
jgi:uncharacterized membrane protein